MLLPELLVVRQQGAIFKFVVEHPGLFISLGILSCQKQPFLLTTIIHFRQVNPGQQSDRGELFFTRLLEVSQSIKAVNEVTKVYPPVGDSDRSCSVSFVVLGKIVVKLNCLIHPLVEYVVCLVLNVIFFLKISIECKDS